jgi:putative selenium metabolism hydrolase
VTDERPIDIDQIVTICRDMVSHPSMPGEEGAVADVAKSAAVQLGYDEVDVDEFGNITARRRARDSRGLIVFDGHIDTVGVGDPAQWSENPYSAVERDGRLFGRGVSDMKGAVAAMLVGLASVPRDELSADVVVSASVCEEAVEGVALGKVLDTYPADIVVIGESTDCELAIGQRGRGEILVETFGRAAHSSTPQLGINAVKHMAQVIQTLSAITPPVHSILGPGVFEVTDVMSHPYPGLSVIPERCAATFDRRLLVAENETSVLAWVESALMSLRDADPEIDVRVRIPESDVTTYPGTPMRAPKFSPAWLLEPDHPAVVAGLDALRLAGLPAVTRTYSFCTNGSESAGRRQIPTLGFGPGSESQAHRVDESVAVQQLADAARGYAALAQTLGAAIGR